MMAELQAIGMKPITPAQEGDRACRSCAFCDSRWTPFMCDNSAYVAEISTRSAEAWRIRTICQGRGWVAREVTA